MINSITVDEICSDSFTVSWTSTSDEILSYNVMLSPPSQSLTTLNTYNNFTGLTPNTSYSVTVVASGSLGSGTPMVIVVTTLTVEAGRPLSKIFEIWLCLQCGHICVRISVKQTRTQHLE